MVKKKFRPIIFRIMGTIVILFLVLCYFQGRKTSDHRDDKPRYGGTLVYGTYNAPIIINPILTNHSVSAALIPLIFDSLVRTNHEEKIVPGLAESWDVSADKMTYTFYLHQGVKFHDGHELTAEDVKFTYDYFLDPKIQSPYRTHFRLVDRFNIIDKYTFQVILKKPFFPFLYKMITSIMPKHLLVNEELHNTSFNYHPIGTGPFRFKDWDRETNQITLEANPDYFEGRPYLDKIIVKTYPDAGFLWAAFLRGEVDMVKFITRQGYIAIKDDPAFKAYQTDWNMYYAMVYNLNDPDLSNKEIRKAIAYSINKARIIEESSDGGTEATGPFHPQSIGFNPDIQSLEYSPTKGKEILRQQGWRDSSDAKGGEEHGVRTKNGQEFEFRLLIDESNKEHHKIAMMIHRDLSEIGIRLIRQFYQDEDELTEEYLEQYQPQAWLRFYLGLNEDVAGVLKSWDPSSSEFGRLWNYTNEEVGQLFELSRTTQDKNTLKETYQKIHKIVYDDHLAYFLFFTASFRAVSAKFQNTDELFSPTMPDYTIKDWHIADH